MRHAHGAAIALLGALVLALAVGTPAASRSSGGYGVSLVKDVNPSGGIAPMGVVAVGGTLFFDANDGVHGNELWRSNGTAVGTTLAKDIVTGALGSNPTRT